MDPLELDRLGDIPDPFAGAAGAPVGAPAPRGMPPSPSRGRVRALRAGALAAALVCEALWVSTWEHRVDLASAPRVGLALGLGIPLVAGAVALGAAARRGGLGLGESSRRLAAFVAASITVFVAGTMMFAPPDTEAAGFWSHAVRCMAVTAVLAAAPLALGVWAFRHAFVASTRWRGAGIGTAAGALAAATMSVVCSSDGVVHVLVGHGLMMVVGAAAGALLGGRVMRA
jgi:hypothetical protein